MQSNRSKKTLVIEGIIRVISMMVLLLLLVVIGSKVVGEAVAGLLAVVLIIILLLGGALIGYGKVDWGVEVLISVALVELLGVVIYSNKIELKVIVLEVLLVLGAFVISRIFKREPKFIIFLIAAFFVWLFLYFIVEENLLDSMIVSVLVDILLDKVYQYYVKCNEIYYLHKLGESCFNKEYFDVYFNRVSIFYRVCYYIACISVVIYVEVPRIENFFTIVEGDLNYPCFWSYLNAFVTTFEIFIFLSLLVLAVMYLLIKNSKNSIKYCRNMEKLVEEKKYNFGPYTDSEKEIILE